MNEVAPLINCTYVLAVVPVAFILTIVLLYTLFLSPSAAPLTFLICLSLTFQTNTESLITPSGGVV